MVPVGSARNGDLLVINFDGKASAQIGLVSHDELWEGDDPPGDLYVPVSDSVDEYLYRAAEELSVCALDISIHWSGELDG